jgi:hypothetical protein
VSASCAKNNARRCLRLVSLLLFLTIFFLPLHFHPVAATAHLTKECSCIHGTRTEMGMVSAQVDWAPPIGQIFQESFKPDFFLSLVASLQSIRAPPAL